MHIELYSKSNKQVGEDLSVKGHKAALHYLSPSINEAGLRNCSQDFSLFFSFGVHGCY